ncbi:hypothetical protein SO694_00116013 [Aureococcus anophagefferens]|uniref:Arf-GAP domain-containing protein n=2 Tax=Aureococcus anophagefferens TaxID=44056 RepID=A0ABR1FWL3_AURAN
MSSTVQQTRAARERLKKLLKLPGNSTCADCSTPGRPNWASVSLGVFLCRDCATIHRGLGSHVSRVRSVGLDEWTTAQVDKMERWGNAAANAYFEASVPYDARLSAAGTTTNQRRTRFLRDKYEKCNFVGPTRSGATDPADPRNGGVPGQAPAPPLENGMPEGEAVKEAMRRSLFDAKPKSAEDLLSFDAPAPAAAPAPDLFGARAPRDSPPAAPAPDLFGGAPPGPVDLFGAPPPPPAGFASPPAQHAGQRRRPAPRARTTASWPCSRNRTRAPRSR